MFNLDGINHYGEMSIQDIILDNIVQFLRYGFLQIGAYVNIGYQELDSRGNDMSLLTPLSVPGTTDYTIYKGRKHDWVWENNITLKPTGVDQPTQVSGIYVNSTYYPTGSTVLGTGYYIDFTRGHVVFSNPLPSSYIVQVPHTLRWVQIYTDRSYEYRKLSYDWLNSTGGSGLDYGAYEKAFLPCIVVTPTKLTTIQGWELGGRSKVLNCNIDFNILAANDYERDKLTDICQFLETKTIPFFDAKNYPKPLNYRGEISSGTMFWPNVVSGYPLNYSARFMENAKTYKINRPTLPVKASKVSIGLELVVTPY